MMRGVLIASLAALLGLAGPALAAERVEPPARDWSFDGVFGTYDKAALQRGFQVYKEICAGCHGLKYITFRNLAGIGLSEDAIKAVANEYEVEDGPDAEGEMFFRAAIASDHLPAPYANANAARAANNGALPPDLSLVTKARKGGPDYIYALLTGYDEAPEEIELPDGMNFNTYFPGQQIAMPEPLYEDGVEYADGTPATVEQMAGDVTHFLMWAAEPTLEARKRLGVKTMLFLFVLTALFYASKRRIWANVKH